MPFACPKGGAAEWTVVRMSNPFDDLVERYDSWFDRHASVYRAELDAVRSLLPVSFRDAVEVGVGTGRFAVPLGIRLGIEPSHPMAVVARQRGIAVVEGRAESLPLASGEFDLVLFVTTLCFVDDAKQSLREAHRVLRSEGHVLIAFVDKDSPCGRRYEASRGENPFYQGAHFYSEEEIRTLLHEANFQEVSARRLSLAVATSQNPPGIVGAQCGDIEPGDFAILVGRKPACLKCFRMHCE